LFALVALFGGQFFAWKAEKVSSTSDRRSWSAMLPLPFQFEDSPNSRAIHQFRNAGHTVTGKEEVVARPSSLL
jgi:hypothetical protein